MMIEQRERLEEVATAYAAEPLASSEEELDSLTSEAIGELRLQDATFWQRVKFRSRMIRAVEQGRQRRSHSGANGASRGAIQNPPPA